jgi:Mn-dependent DtxR family transcriptional regulator
MNHNESVEDYLETILIISEEKPVVRSVDIANEMGFSKPSISVAVKNMREKVLIEVSDEGYITLTESGRALAERVYDRHKFFRKWLISLGVDEETANDDACRIEHVITEETFEAIRKKVEGQ